MATIQLYDRGRTTLYDAMATIQHCDRGRTTLYDAGGAHAT